MGCVAADDRCDGDELPQREITLSGPFDLMATEATASLYRGVVRDADEQPPWSTNADHPVAVLTWDEAQSFCQALGGRLPTEAEWERAARGGQDGTVYPWGNEEPAYEVTAPNGAAFETDSAREVRSGVANPYGLFHMAGNMWEWVADWYGGLGDNAATDPVGVPDGTFRVVRGGSYGDDSSNLRISNRNFNRPGNVNVNVGVRCARDVAPAPEASL